METEERGNETCYQQNQKANTETKISTKVNYYMYKTKTQYC